MILGSILKVLLLLIFIALLDAIVVHVSNLCTVRECCEGGFSLRDLLIHEKAKLVSDF